MGEGTPICLFLVVAVSIDAQTNYSGLPPQFVCGVVSTPTIRNPQKVDYPEAICTDPNSTKWIRINIHFISKSDGTGNFNVNDDGNGDPNMNGYKRAEIIINECNIALADNQKMWRPFGSNTPVQPIRVRYLLAGVYFHNSDYWIETYNGQGPRRKYDDKILQYY